MSEQKKGIIACVALSLVYATMGIYIRSLANFGLFQQVYLRIFGAVFIGTIIFWRSISFRKFKKVSKKDWLILAWRGFTFAAGVILFTVAFLTTKYTNATFIESIPLLPLFGLVFLKENLNIKRLAWILVSFCGLVLISLNGLHHFSFGKGELCALLAAVAFNLNYISRKSQSDYLNDKESLIVIFFIEAVLVLIASLLIGEGAPKAAAFTHFSILIIFIAALANVATLYLINYGLRRVEAVVAGNLLTLENAFALFIGIGVYREIPALTEIFGGVLIVLAAIMINLVQSDTVLANQEHNI